MPDTLSWPSLFTGASGAFVAFTGVVVLAVGRTGVHGLALGVFLIVFGIPYALAGFVGTFPFSPFVSHALGWLANVSGLGVMTLVASLVPPRGRPWILAASVGLLVALLVAVPLDASPRLTGSEGFVHAFVLGGIAILASVRAAVADPDDARGRRQLLALTWLTGLTVVCALVPRGTVAPARFAGLAIFALTVAAAWLCAARGGRWRVPALAAGVVVAFAAARIAVFLDADASDEAFALLIGVARMAGAVAVGLTFVSDEPPLRF